MSNYRREIIFKLMRPIPIPSFDQLPDIINEKLSIPIPTSAKYLLEYPIVADELKDYLVYDDSIRSPFDLIILTLLIDKKFRFDGNETNQMLSISRIVDETILEYSDYLRLKLESDRNLTGKSDQSLTTQQTGGNQLDKMPNFVCHDSEQELIFFGVERNHCELDKAYFDIKMGINFLDSIYSSNYPYLFVYATGGSKFRLHAFDYTTKTFSTLLTLNLTVRKQRFQLFAALTNIIRIVYLAMKANYSTKVKPSFGLFTTRESHRGGKIQFMQNHVMKTIPNTCPYNFRAILEAYRVLRHEKVQTSIQLRNLHTYQDLLLDELTQLNSTP